MSINLQTARIYMEESLKYKRQFFSLWAVLPLPIIFQSILYPILYASIIDNLSRYAGGAEVLQSDVMSLFLWIIVLEAVQFTAWRWIDFTMISLQPKIMRNLDRRVFDWYMQLSYSFHTKSFGGSLVARGRRFVSEYERLFDTFYFEIAPLIIRFIFYMIVLGFRAPSIAITLFIWSIFYIWAQFWIIKRKTPVSRAAAEADSAVTGNLADSITNISSVKTFGRREFEFKRFKKTTDTHLKKRFKSWRLDYYIRTWQSVLMIIVSLFILYLLIDLLFADVITIGTVVLASLYIRRLMDDLWNIGRTMMRVERALSDAAEMTKTFYTPLDVEDSDQPSTLAIKDGLIRFEDVTFKYEDSAAQAHIFKNLDLTIEPGTRIGLVGPSGGGKTTITKLLLRLHNVDGGKIFIDGQDVNQLTQADLRSAIAFVPQEPVLFHRSLADNIRYGNPKASDDEVKKAAKLARATQFIDKLPKTYDTLVGERGTKLSGGEKQRVAIARAALKDAPILVLDEATSALDSESEKLIQAALDDLMENRTTIVIAHRLSTIQKMDRIIVLEDGVVIEDGTHKELLELDGLYATLWGHQSGGFIED